MSSPASVDGAVVGGFTTRTPTAWPVTLQGQDGRRIQALAIPPAWTEVWVCPARGRPHPGHRTRRRTQAVPLPRPLARCAACREVRSAGASSAEVMPRAAQVDGPPPPRGLPRARVLAWWSACWMSTLIRVGNPEYADENDLGLTTLRRRPRAHHPPQPGGFFDSWARAAWEHDVTVRLPALWPSSSRSGLASWAGQDPLHVRRRRRWHLSTVDLDGDVNDLPAGPSPGSTFDRQGLPDLGERARLVTGVLAVDDPPDADRDKRSVRSPQPSTRRRRTCATPRAACCASPTCTRRSSSPTATGCCTRTGVAPVRGAASIGPTGPCSARSAGGGPEVSPHDPSSSDPARLGREVSSTARRVGTDRPPADERSNDAS